MMGLRKYQGQLFYSRGQQSFYKSAETGGILHMQGLNPGSGTMNALEIQQEQNNEQLKSAGRLLPHGRRFFQQKYGLLVNALQKHFNYCQKIQRLKLRVTKTNSL